MEYSKALEIAVHPHLAGLDTSLRKRHANTTLAAPTHPVLAPTAIRS